MVTLIHVHQGVQKLFIFTHNDTIMRNSRRFKCAPTFGGSLSIHMFTLLFRLIADSSVFTSDFTWECMNAIETGRPFVYLRRMNNSFNINHFSLHSCHSPDSKKCQNFILYFVRAHHLKISSVIANSFTTGSKSASRFLLFYIISLQM